MNRARNFYRKKPHILPPLANLEPPAVKTMTPLQPPDLILTGNRLGSPAPKRTMPVEYDDILSTAQGKPIITIFEPCLKENEKYNMKMDLLCDEIFQEDNSRVENLNSTFDSGFEMSSKNNEGENLFMKSLSKNQKLKAHEIHSLEDTEDLKNFEFKVLQIPNRYKPLKPIGRKTES